VLLGQGVERVARVLNNENIFSMETLPKRLLVLGAGPIGIELAEALAMLGTEVTVVDPGAEILGKEDPAMAAVVRVEMEKQGVVFRLGYQLHEFVGTETAELTSGTGEIIREQFDAVFVGIGRVLNTEGLALDKAGIAVDAAGKLVVDSYLRTTNKKVFVCGDIAGNYQFTHAAEMHAAVILRNFFSPIKIKFNADAIAWTTFTTPELATFGVQEVALKKRGVVYRVLETDFSEDDRAITDAYQYAKAKLFVSPKGRILGGTMVAPNAGELVQELILAQSAKLSVAALFAKVYPYPTATRINKRLAATFSAEKLTPLSKRLLRLIY
jgi:pyruvate/2-oxoglutarate dehydrogenase complex dihydrolipoamide dehydrogenase (E3) component